MFVIILIVICALLYPGTIDRTKAILSGRRGPKVYQFIFDSWRLFKKGNVYSDKSSFVFQISAIINFACLLTCLFLIPFPGSKPILSFDGDFVFMLYLLGLGRFIQVVAALDVSSGFEGMGANREVLYASLLEPAFFLLMGTMCIFTGFTNFNDIFIKLYENQNEYLGSVVIITSAIIVFMFLLVDNSRIPTDDPNTHLELTMVHEVMVLDHSGFDLGLIKLTSALKFAVFGSIICCLVIPSRPIIADPSLYILDMGLKIVLYMLFQFIMAVAIGFVESFKPRNKMARNPQYILSISAIAAVLFCVMIIIKNNVI
jgi:formate hydrogenlyase subunit 4